LRGAMHDACDLEQRVARTRAASQGCWSSSNTTRDQQTFLFVPLSLPPRDTCSHSAMHTCPPKHPLPPFLLPVCECPSVAFFPYSESSDNSPLSVVSTGECPSRGHFSSCVLMLVSSGCMSHPIFFLKATASDSASPHRRYCAPSCGSSGLNSCPGAFHFCSSPILVGSLSVSPFYVLTLFRHPHSTPCPSAPFQHLRRVSHQVLIQCPVLPWRRARGARNIRLRRWRCQCVLLLILLDQADAS